MFSFVYVPTTKSHLSTAHTTLCQVAVIKKQAIHKIRDIIIYWVFVIIQARVYFFAPKSNKIRQFTFKYKEMGLHLSSLTFPVKAKHSEDKRCASLTSESLNHLIFISNLFLGIYFILSSVNLIARKIFIWNLFSNVYIHLIYYYSPLSRMYTWISLQKYTASFYII